MTSKVWRRRLEGDSPPQLCLAMCCTKQDHNRGFAAISIIWMADQSQGRAFLLYGEMFGTALQWAHAHFMQKRTLWMVQFFLLMMPLWVIPNYVRNKQHRSEKSCSRLPVGFVTQIKSKYGSSGFKSISSHDFTLCQGAPTSQTFVQRVCPTIIQGTSWSSWCFFY